MCLSDNKLLREVQCSSRLVTVGASAVELLQASPYRVGLLIGSLDAIVNGVTLVVAPDAGVTATSGLVVAGNMLQLNWRDHGPVVQKPWFGVLGQGTGVLVVESILPAEWWPALMGDVPYDNIRRVQ